MDTHHSEQRLDDAHAKSGRDRACVFGLSLVGDGHDAELGLRRGGSEYDA